MPAAKTTAAPAGRNKSRSVAERLEERIERPSTAAPAKRVAVKGEQPPKNIVAEERTTAVRARPVRLSVQPKPKEPPEMVLVRAIEKGFAGEDVDIIVRNPGEVFELATSKMRKWPLGKGEHPIENPVVIETPKGQFELPGWVELVEDDEVIDPADRISRGHPDKIVGQVSKEHGTSMSDGDGRKLSAI